MSSGNRRPMKVVIIDTQYIETDAVSFKSVVQRLTGKDAEVKAEPSAKTDEQKRSQFSASENMSNSNINNVPVFSRGMSFKEFDMLLKELPPLEELYRLYADN